jgi:hypothetical protein
MPSMLVPRFRVSIGLLLALALAVAVALTRAPGARAAGAEISPGDPVSFATPGFLAVGQRYAFTWPGGGPPQTYTVKSIRRDGWIVVEVAEDNTNPAFHPPGELPTMWLHVGMAISIQPMRPLQ